MSSMEPVNLAGFLQQLTKSQNLTVSFDFVEASQEIEKQLKTLTKQLIQESVKFTTHSLRTKMTATDLVCALTLHNEKQSDTEWEEKEKTIKEETSASAPMKRQRKRQRQRQPQKQSQQQDTDLKLDTLPNISVASSDPKILAFLRSDDTSPTEMYYIY
ncbi:hypothetical protein RFI_17130, partial [Reticulomyxa filosa]